MLADLGGQPMLFQIVRRLRLAGELDEVAVATSDDPSDEPLIRACGQFGVAVHRGPVDDIVSRMHKVAAAVGAAVLVRVWGDCPFVDPAVVDEGVSVLRKSKADFVSNCAVGQRTYPPGLDFEAYRWRLLERMAADVTDPAHREFPVEFVRCAGATSELLQLDQDLSELHLTVDYPEDLEAARAIYAVLQQRRLGPDLATLLTVLAEQPALAEGFADAPRNPEYRRYLQARARE